MTDECEKKAVELGFDLTKQFLTLAFAGIAFVVGLSFSTPSAVSSLMFWLVVASFGLSAVLGLLFLMHGVSTLAIEKTYDIYSVWLQRLAISQISLVLIGTALLVPILSAPRRNATQPSTLRVEIRNPQQTVVYPIDQNRDVAIDINGANIKVTPIQKVPH